MSAKAIIIKCRTKPACQEMSQVNLAPVLKVVNDLADDAATTVRGNSGLKVDRAMRAVGACENTGNGPFKWLGTLLAKRRNDTHGFCFALHAEIFTSSSLTTADCAYRRIEKRCGRPEQFKRAKRDHISTRFA